MEEAGYQTGQFKVLHYEESSFFNLCCCWEPSSRVEWIHYHSDFPTAYSYCISYIIKWPPIKLTDLIMEEHSPPTRNPSAKQPSVFLSKTTLATTYIPNKILLNALGMDSFHNPWDWLTEISIMTSNVPFA